MLKITQKLATIVAAVSMLVTPLQTASALSTSGSTASGYDASQSAYQDKWTPYAGSAGTTGSAYDENLNKLRDSFGVGSGSTGSTSNQVGVGGSSTGSNQVPVGGSSSGSTSNQVGIGGGNYGNSALPGGYKYNPNLSNKVAIGSTTGGAVSNKVTVGGSGYDSGSVDNKVNVGGGNYGNSALPGGYQYNPNVSNKVTVGGSAYGNGSVDNKVSVGGGNYGNSLVPGGYQYDPTVSNKVAIAGNTGNTGSTGSVNNKVAVGTSEDVDNKVPYNPGSFDDYDTELQEGYYFCKSVSSSKTVFARTNREGSLWTVYYYDEDGDLIKTLETTMVLYDSWRPQMLYSAVRDCEPISKELFELYVNGTHSTDDVISLCDGKPYPRDIDGHWSEIYVRRLYDLCVVEGYEDGNFRPNANVTRAELVKMGLFANGIEPNQGCYDNDCGSPYRDLDSWQGQWVRVAYDKGIVEGYVYDQFRPNQAITRAEAVKVVLATYGYAPTGDTKSFFNDVDGWSIGWVERARLIGLVQGIGNGNFDPNRPITRAEAAKIVAKMIEYWDTSVREDNKNR